MSSQVESTAGREELLPTRSSLLDRLRDWADTGLAPEVFDGQNVVNLEAIEAAAFFRLRKP